MLKFYGLDPRHYFSSVGVSWDAMSTFISYLDMSNLYGWAMSGYLPYGGFKWLKNVDNFDVNSISKESPIGYILEVDLKHRDELHLLHNDYPFTPEKLPTSYDMLSDYCKKITEKLWNKSW